MSERAEGIPWHPVSRVEKYSAEQTAWARQRLDEELSWGRRLVVRTLGITVPVLHGDWLREVFREPEDGYAYDEGNGVAENGLANLALLLTGTGGHPLAPGRTVFGVGTDGETEFSPGHVHLANAPGEGHGRSWYRPMDPGFPAPGPAAVTGQATFTEREANMAWAEWCWASGEPGLSPGPVLGSCFAGEHAMLNRKAPAGGFGVKEPGVAWVFQTEITFRRLLTADGDLYQGGVLYYLFRDTAGAGEAVLGVKRIAPWHTPPSGPGRSWYGSDGNACIGGGYRPAAGAGRTVH